jgi:pimeloyl-ACP methyl ester carboxylesterase
MSKPTIVLVPGSFSPVTAYSTLTSHFRAHGFPALAVALPSTQKRIGFPPATMQDDASVIKRVAETLLAQGKQVVVICHSYGGTPTSEALVGVKVKRIVYLTAMVPKVGQTQTTTMDIVVPMETIVSVPPIVWNCMKKC